MTWSRHPLVVRLGVGEHERVEPLDAGSAQPPQDRAAGRAGVDEDRRAAVLQQRRVALADVEEGDDELAGGGGAARRRRGRATTSAERGGRRAGAPAADREPSAAAARRRRAAAQRIAKPARGDHRRAAGRVGQRETRRTAEPHRQRGGGRLAATCAIHST